MPHPVYIQQLLTERAVRENHVTAVAVTENCITVTLEPQLPRVHERGDCQHPVPAKYHDSTMLTVQGLGVQGKALRYHIKSTRLGYVNDAGQFITFTVPLVGIRTDLLVTEEVVDKVLYLNVDRNLSLPVTAEMLGELYQVQTSASALDRWKRNAAAKLPAIGALIMQLNQKKR